jgi:FkbM family methyltransferase
MNKTSPPLSVLPDGVGETVRSGRAASGLADLQHLTTDFASAVEEFENVRNEARLDRLRELRLRIAEALLTLPDSAAKALGSPFNAIAAACLKSDFRAMPRSPAEDALFRRCRDALAAAPSEQVAARGIAALLLSSHAFELGFVPPLTGIPQEMRASWLALLMETPQAFVHRGDADRFVRYLGQVCERLQQYLHVTTGGVDDITTSFFGSPAFIQAYFNESNLRDLMRRRAVIVEELLARRGGALDQLRVMRPCAKRPRIGFVAFQVAESSEGVYLAAHMERLNRHRFDVRLYTIGAPTDRIGALCRAAADTHVQLPAEVAAAVARLRRDDLDVALFSTNLTAAPHLLTQIAAHRVARIQGDTGASPVTTGLRNMDVMFSGEPNETEESESHYTERLVRTTGALNCYPFQYVLEGLTPPSAVSRAAHGIPEDAVVYFSAANFYKILPELSEVWFQILARVPQSYLILMPFNPNWSNKYQVTSFHMRLHRQIAEAGVPTNRLLLHPPVPTIAHLHRVMQIADIYLDAFPFSGACSIFDALEVGLPIVAKAGGVCRSRHSKAILEEAGLGDWAVSDSTSYVNRALELGRDVRKRTAERERLAQARERGLKLVDTTRYASMLMTSFDEILADWNERVEALHALAPSELAQRIAALVPQAAEELGVFADRDLVLQVVLPYLRSGGSRRLLDIGACVGAMSRPFLAEGWQTVMFEPDQRCHATLAAIAEAYPGQVRIEKAVVTADRDGSVKFHVAGSPGLSGMSRSPFAADLAVLDVPAIAISAYIARNGLFDVDFIKIDAEGHDLAILDGIDLGRLAPRLIMVEFGDDFAGQDRAAIEAALVGMRHKGYRACVVCLRPLGDFARHDWRTGLLAIGIDAVPVPPQGAQLFGNILFFRAEDGDFLTSLCDWLEQFGERRRRGLAPRG